MKKPTQLKAKFHKIYNDDGTLNSNQSRWEVFTGEELLFIITVEEQCKLYNLTYNEIATHEFGEKLLIKTKKMTAYW